MATIVETIAGDRRLQLVNEEVVRKFDFGARWSSLIVGFRCSINASATLTATPELFFGLCAGNDAYKAASVTASFGFRFPAVATDDLTYAAGPPAYYVSSTVNCIGSQSKVGSSVTGPTRLFSGSTLGYVAAGTTLPNSFAFLVTKVGTAYSISRVFFPTTIAQAQAGLDPSQFLSNMDNPVGSPAVISQTAANTTYSFTDANAFDRAFIYWNHSTDPLEISEWRVTRIS